MSPSLGVYAMTRPSTQLTADGSGDWRDRAACVGDNPNEWDECTQYAREVCRACPVAIQCLDAAMTAERGFPYSGRSSLYAGLTPLDRARLARRNRTAGSAS
jgi:hypothetical protein